VETKSKGSHDDFTDEIRLKRARRVVPLESFAVTVPQLETVLFFTIFVTEIILSEINKKWNQIKCTLHHSKWVDFSQQQQSVV